MLAPDSITVTDQASGVEHATTVVSGKHYPVVMIAGPTGHINDSTPTYYYWSGFAAGAANQKILEIFNATGSGVKVKVRKMFVQSNMVAGTHVGQEFRFDKSSAVGTGGTTITGRAADSNNAAIPAQVTARARPTGGATSNFQLFGFGMDGEETRPASGILGMINWIPEGPNVQEIVLNENEGCFVQQVTSSTATTWGVLMVVTIH